MRGPLSSVRLSGPNQAARFLDRPHALRVRVVVEPEEVITEADLATPGPLPGLDAGDRVWLRPAPEGRERPILSLAQTSEGTLVALEPRMGLALIEAGLAEGALPELMGFDVVRREVPFGTSRFDLEIRSSIGQRGVVDVKTLTVTANGAALFPAGPSEREVRQVRSLARLAASDPSTACALVFVAQRVDARVVVAARHLEPDIVPALHEAQEAGVRLIARRCQVTLEELVLGVPVEVKVIEATRFT